MEFLSSFSFLQLLSVVVASIFITGAMGWWLGYAAAHEAFPSREFLTAFAMVIILLGLVILNILIGFIMTERLDSYLFRYMFTSLIPPLTVYGAFFCGPKLAEKYYS